MRIRPPSRAAWLAVAGGLMVAAALPPWGWWPLAFVGVALFETSLGENPTGKQRLTRGWLFGAAWLFPGMVWMWFLTAPGYLVAATVFAGFHALAAFVAPCGPWRAIGRPAAHTVAEALRFVFPFGGVPLASLAVGQAASPFAGVVRVGGALLLTWFVFQVGFALAGPSPVVPQMARRRGVTARPQWHGVAALGAALVVWVISPLAAGTLGSDPPGRDLRVAAVQGGGPQGTRAVSTNSREVVERHLAATRTIAAGSVDLVVWPENVVDVYRFEGSRELGEIAAEAARIGAPISVGITEDTDDDRFLNAQVIVTTDGEVTSRYEKVRRVPFGEYMPLRGLLEAVGAPTDLVPRNAVEGKGPAVLDLPDGTRVGVAISWEVFFGPRVRDGVTHGGSLVLNPTNGSSYTWTVLQTQQVASSRLRALEQNRWVVQASPTGFSAFVSPDGEVFQRTSVSEQEVIVRTVELRATRTWYSHLGDGVVSAAMILLLAAAWHVPGRAWLRGRHALASDAHA